MFLLFLSLLILPAILPLSMVLILIIYKYCFQIFFYILNDTYKRHQMLHTNKYHIHFVHGWYLMNKKINKLVILHIILFLFTFLLHSGAIIATFMLVPYLQEDFINLFYSLIPPALLITIASVSIFYIIFIRNMYISIKSKSYFNTIIKSTKITYDNMLNDEFKNNGLLPLNYIVIYDIIAMWNIINIKKLKKIFKEDTYYILAFYIYDMDKSVKSEYIDNYQGFFYNYVNYFNKDDV
ncbi:hypothetical protein ACXYRK_02070 [Mycoplasma sp. AC1221]